MSTNFRPSGALKTVALIGNPNTGKTTLFNALTGLSQRVGNYSGVTVERKVGQVDLEGSLKVDLLDLPGTYSLAANSPDEMIAVDVLLGQQEGVAPLDAVLAIVDASNLKRNLYLVSQLLETGLPVVVALNMIDVAASRHTQVDATRLAAKLGVPVVPVVAHRRQGVEALRAALAACLQEASNNRVERPQLPSALWTQAERISQAAPTVEGRAPLTSIEAFRALVDVGGHAEHRLVDEHGADFARLLEDCRRAVGGSAPLSALESEGRYIWIDQVVEGALQQQESLYRSRSDRVDKVLTHRLWGSLIFVAFNAVIFQAIYSWAGPLMDGIEGGFALLGAWIGGMMAEGALRSLVVDGVIGGVGGVLIFLPQIVLLFLFIALLEDCGYMARAALLMDRFLTSCGLSGKSFIPLLSSFACAVPGIMATRTIEDRRDRFTTIVVAPLMSCSARLPVYIIFIAAFIPDKKLLGDWIGLQGLTLFAMYGLGVVVAVPVAWLLKKTLLKGEAPPLLLELPSYKWPVPWTVGLRVYQSGRAFVLRAGSIILATTVAMWALAYFPRHEDTLQHYQDQRVQALQLEVVQQQQALERIDQAEAGQLLQESYLGRAGHWFEPLVRPLGWDWRIGMATLASFPAREVIISVLGTVYSLGGDHDEESEDLRTALQGATWPDGRKVLTIPVALSIMVFFALCAQCSSTLVTIQRETQSWGWAGFTFVYMTLLAYFGGWAVYRLASGLGWGS
ncbi:MAG: ferrous iron transport protein B [Candidatus Latescibacteria bacterium]|nr:ferrous iron transport protein B [Candidatus Latescibacterota bacterium]